jgi:hypothetical protein
MMKWLWGAIEVLQTMDITGDNTKTITVIWVEHTRCPEQLNKEL